MKKFCVILLALMFCELQITANAEENQAREEAFNQCSSSCNDEGMSCVNGAGIVGGVGMLVGMLGKSTDDVNRASNESQANIAKCQSEQDACNTDCARRLKDSEAVAEAERQAEQNKRDDDARMQSSLNYQNSLNRTNQQIQETIQQKASEDNNRSRQMAEERQQKNLAQNTCHNYSNQVTGTTKWHGKGGTCVNDGRGELEGFLTNNSGLKLTCSTRFIYPDGSIHDEGLGDFNAGVQNIGGEWGGTWSCAPVGTRFEWKCALASDDSNCHRI